MNSNIVGLGRKEQPVLQQVDSLSVLTNTQNAQTRGYTALDQKRRQLMQQTKNRDEMDSSQEGIKPAIMMGNLEYSQSNIKVFQNVKADNYSINDRMSSNEMDDESVQRQFEGGEHMTITENKN